MSIGFVFFSSVSESYFRTFEYVRQWTALPGRPKTDGADGGTAIRGEAWRSTNSPLFSHRVMD